MSGPGDGNGSQEASRVLLAASEQITLALKDAQQPIDVLGASLGKLAALLAADAGDAPTAQQLAALRGEMARAVTGLQFYDRMAQHLNHVRDYLTHSAEHIGSEVGIPAEPWASTHQTLANRLLSETHRMFLGKNFPEEFMANRGGLSREERGAASPGDIDLF